MLQDLNILDNEPLSILSLVIHIALGSVFSLAISWHFKKFGSTLSNRAEFAQVLPFILLTTLLIITIVKTSLALSLGLVGALSIVRFRTPIKEPEELAYLFIAIGIGLGLGAEQTLATLIGGASILGLVAIFKRYRSDDHSKNLFVSIDGRDVSSEDQEGCLDRLNEVILRHVISCDLRRFDVRSRSIEATYFVDVAGTNDLSPLIDELRSDFPDFSVTFLDQSQLPSV